MRPCYLGRRAGLKNKMRLVLIADVFPPARTSGAALVHDLAICLARMGHHCTVLIPDAHLGQPFILERGEEFELLRIRSGPIKRVNIMRRAVNELLLSSRMWRAYRRSPVSRNSYDGVIFYAPTIFFGRLVSRIKSLHRCRAYLVLRDIFPDWAADVGVMRKGPHYWLFKAFAKYQYSVADVIGVESASNIKFFNQDRYVVEILNNWIDVESVPVPVAYKIPSALYSTVVFVYAGNLGVAQDIDNVLRLAQRLMPYRDCSVLFVGDGTERVRLQRQAQQLGLTNVLFQDEVNAAELRGILRQCDIGLISLDKRLRSHNIPGKLLSYLEAGLPVLASVNAGNDLKDVIEQAGAGIVVWNGDDDAFEAAARHMVNDRHGRDRMANLARRLCDAQFSSAHAASQILKRLSREPM